MLQAYDFFYYPNQYFEYAAFVIYEKNVNFLNEY